MFKKLYRNIYLPIVLITVALILIIDIFSIIMLTQTLKSAYNGMDQKRVSRALDSCELYVSSVAASAYNLSLDKDLIDELASHAGNSIADKLNNTCNYSLKIDAVCAYSANGTVYTSSQIAGVPTLDELKQVNEIKEFMDGDEASAVSLRTEYIADIYDNTFYPAQMGVITCCRKVFDGDNVVGWIFADILPANFYSFLFSNGQFDRAVAFITFKDSFFHYADNSSHGDLLNGKHNAYFRYEVTADDDLFSIIVFNSTKEYVLQLTTLIAILLSVSVGLVVAVHFAAKYTAKSVTKRLDNLSEKMNSQKIV